MYGKRQESELTEILAKICNFNYLGADITKAQNDSSWIPFGCTFRSVTTEANDPYRFGMASNILCL